MSCSTSSAAAAWAYDPELDRKVAVKLLRAGGGDGSEARARLLREAQAIARLAHPNVIAVHDVGTLDDQVFVAMEYVDGQTLKLWQRQPRSPREIVDMYSQAARGLAAAHAAGLVHRDFKPDNALVGGDGRLRVLDFGLARSADEPDKGAPVADAPAVAMLSQSSSSSSRPPSGALALPLTRAGALVGTPQYMAPEQFAGARTDARSDQFSFCVALYEALYGERPFAGDSIETLQHNVVAGRLREPPRDRRVPRRLRRLLQRGLQTVPGARFSSMDALVSALTVERAVPLRWAAIAAVVVTVASVIGWRAARRHEVRVCAGADQLAAVWNPARRHAVSDAFAATRRPFAAAAVAAIDRALDGYAAAWSAQRIGACEATRVTGEQSEELLDLRMQCLDERRSELAALVDVFAHADAAVVEHAVTATQGLGDLEACANRVALKAPIKPARPELRAQVAALRTELAVARARGHAGRVTEALAQARAVSDQARALAYAPLEAEALVERGELEWESDRPRDAAETLTQAIIAAERGRDDASAARAWTNRIGVDNGLARYDEANNDARHAEVWIERAGGDRKLLADFHSARGNVEANLGRYDDARADDERALQLRIARGGESDSAVGSSHLNLGVLAYQRGRAAEAEAEFRRALDIWQATLGAEHPDVAMAWNNLGAAYVDEKRFDDSLTCFRRALAIYQSLFGDMHPDVAMALSNVGDVLCKKGRCAEALPLLERALSTWEHTLGNTHPNLADALDAIAEADLQLGRAGAAVPRLERALDILAKSPSSANPTLSADLRLKLARALWLSGGDRARSRRLATDSRAGYVAAGERGRDGVKRASEWLAAHR
jgi:eukaryotic-like serine/threonine-protein kinase